MNPSCQCVIAHRPCESRVANQRKDLLCTLTNRAGSAKLTLSLTPAAFADAELLRYPVEYETRCPLKQPLVCRLRIPAPPRDTEMLEKHIPQRNTLLAALPAEVQHRLFPYLELVSLPLVMVLYESGDTMRHVYFPTDSIISLLYVMENGASAEISVVCNEGLVGISLFMGGESTPSRAIVQSGGHAYRLPSQKLKDEFNRHGELLVLMLRYTQALITQMSQTAVCNRHHSIDQQLCRWLLLSLDRLSSNKLSMTQELIANMLGVRREGVTEAAGKLQRQGVIEYSRGNITVLDRHKLEQLSCECYAVVKKETDHLLPFVPSH